MSYRRKNPRGFYQPWSRNESISFTRSLARGFASQAGPFAERLQSLINENDFAGLVNFSLDYDSDVRTDFLVNTRRCIALFQKNSDIDISVDKEAVAWNTFAKAELKCKETNARFDEYESGITDPTVESLILMTQRKISQILGPCPSLDDLHFGFGPGASTTCKRKTSARRKLSTSPVCSEDAYHAISGLMGMFPGYSLSHNGEVRVGTGELSFVPKTAKTHRSIMIEPILNTFVQRGIGRYMKRRLVSFGCNLYDQGINRHRAFLGSLNGNYGTIDLSSASDLIAKKVVATLLPVDWFELLSTWRTSKIEYKKKGLSFRLEKFSSMGNGFTFELESLIFFALSDSVCRKIGIYPDISVYGDDIIVPTEAYQETCNALALFGFEVNTSKSYGSGLFRESCGADYVSGFDIRPFYCKDRWTDARVAACHNHIARSGYDDRAIRSFLLSSVRPYHRKMGPDGYGDGHFVSSYKGKAYRWDQGWQGFLFETFTKVPLKDTAPLEIGDSLMPSYTAYSRELAEDPSDRSSDPFVTRGGEESKVTRIYTLA